jgi:hypothetical protein
MRFGDSGYEDPPPQKLMPEIDSFASAFFIILRGFGSICGELELIYRFEALQGDILRGLVKTKTSDESFMIHFSDL